MIRYSIETFEPSLTARGSWEVYNIMAIIGIPGGTEEYAGCTLWGTPAEAEVHPIGERCANRSTLSQEVYQKSTPQIARGVF